MNGNLARQQPRVNPEARGRRHNDGAVVKREKGPGWNLSEGGAPR